MLQLIMNKNDFCYMLQGKHVADLKENEFSLLKPINQQGKNKTHAVLLLHGFSSSPAVYRHLIPQLKNYDAIICPALPGHGSSIESLSQTKAIDWFNYASELCGNLFKKFHKVDLIGLSLGGLIGCKLSEHFVFNHLFLLAPALKLKGNMKLQLKLAIALHHLGFKELRGAAGSLMTNEQAEISYKRLPINSVIELFRYILNYQWVAPKVPVDLFLGCHDPVVSSPQINQLFQDLSQVSIHWLQNSAHVLALDNDLTEIVTCINARRAVPFSK
jgi:carboxylesterase